MCLSCRLIFLLDDLITDLALKYHGLPEGLSFLISLILGDVPVIGTFISLLGVIALYYIVLSTLYYMTNMVTYDDPESLVAMFYVYARFLIVMSIIGVLLGPLMAINPFTPLTLFLAFGIFLLTGQSDSLISIVGEEAAIILIRSLFSRR